ncbi:hypothetical protein BaRGS_00027777, partial [Batillaria attramentaria]
MEQRCRHQCWLETVTHAEVYRKKKKPWWHTEGFCKEKPIPVPAGSVQLLRKRRTRNRDGRSLTILYELSTPIIVKEAWTELVPSYGVLPSKCETEADPYKATRLWGNKFPTILFAYPVSAPESRLCHKQ